MRRLLPFVLLFGLACGRGPSQATPIPQSVNASLEEFLTAIKANDLQRLGGLWGTERGPAAASMDRQVLRQRLTVIQRYLDHQGYRIVEGPLAVPNRADLRTYRVELQRGSCNHVVPIDIIRTRSGGWLVYDVHLESAGTPRRECQPETGTRP